MSNIDYTLFCNHLWELFKHDRVSRTKWMIVADKLDRTEGIIRKLRTVEDDEEITYQDIISLTHDELDEVIKIITDDPLRWLPKGVTSQVPDRYPLHELPKYRDHYSKKVYQKLARELKRQVDEGVGLDTTSIINKTDIAWRFKT